MREKRVKKSTIRKILWDCHHFIISNDIASGTTSSITLYGILDGTTFISTNNFFA